MVNVEVKEFKIKLGGNEYTFRLDFKALLKFNKKYENALEIFNNFLGGKDVYDAVIKILSCSCIEKDFTEEELSNLFAFNFACMDLVDKITVALIEGVMGENEGKSDGKN